MPKKRRRNPEDRTPKSVLDALFPKVIVVGGLPIHPAQLGHFLALDRLDNPLLLLGTGAPVSAADAAQALFVMSMTGSQAMRLAADRKAFNAAFAEFCARIPFRESPKIYRLVMDRLNDAFKPALPAGSDTPLFPERPAEGPLPAGPSPSTNTAAPNTETPKT